MPGAKLGGADLTGAIKSDWAEDEVKTAYEEERKRGQTVRRWKDHDAYKRSFERAVRDLTPAPKAT